MADDHVPAAANATTRAMKNAVSMVLRLHEFGMWITMLAPRN
jgi:hypothetical protein